MPIINAPPSTAVGVADTRDAMKTGAEASAYVGRDVMSAAAKQGINDLREASWRHAQRRASALQCAQSSSLGSCAGNVQDRDYAQRVHRESNEVLRSSRSSRFEQSAQVGRNECLELSEDMERGPYNFEAPLGDMTFEHFEPHACTKLRKRYITHADMNAYMNCRYAISPSTLYSLTGRNGSSSEYVRDVSQPAMDGDFEVPLYGDWVLFAVMGEKSALKYTSNTSSDAAPSKYFSCKLLDLNTQYTNIYHELPGHCVMNMLAFESSRGISAFDMLWKERDGVLLAILNPRIMRARKGSNEMTISPRSSDSVLVLGLADQYGRCEALCRNGSRCTAFVLRHPKSRGVCAMHLEKAIAGHQRSRMEFATASASYVVPPPSKSLPKYGQQPSKRVRPPTDGLHYVVPGITPSNHDPSSHMYDISSQLGRGLEEKRQRKRRELEETGQLSKLHAHGPEPKSRRMLDAKLLAGMDQNSNAAQALRTAQATLRGEDPKKQHASRTNTTNIPESGAASRLLARHTASAASLPPVKLHSSPFRSNVLDRDNPAARHVEMLKLKEASNTDDDDLVIVSS